MKRMKRTLVAALVAPALAFIAPGCSSDKGVTKETTVGKPPGVNDHKTPRDSSKDDPDSSRRVTPNRLQPGTDDGGEGAPESEDPGGDDADPSSIGASREGGVAEQGRVAGQKVTQHLFQGEKHLRNLRMLTRGGQNAEAYLSPDESRLVFQSMRGELKCDQIFTMGLDGASPKLVSTGKGATTCAYFMPEGDRVLYASTHLGGPKCPPKPDFRKFGGYVWPIHETFDIFVTDLSSGETTALVSSPGYDAEATVSPKGDKIVFTSMRDGDLDIYSMDVDGSKVRRLTTTLGYDGGAFFSHDGAKIVYRAHHIEDEAEAAKYQQLLSQGVVKPSVMELYVMDADGSNNKQVTKHGAASFAPFFHPSGEWIIFASNLHDPKGRDFDLYKVRVDGTGLERLTFNPSFDGFPMFTSDGKRLVFASNRSNTERGETNVFVADWVD